MDPRLREDDGNRERGASAPTKPPTTPSSFRRRRESRRSLGKQHRTLQLHRHSHEGWNPGGVSDSNTAPSNHTVIPAKAGIQTEPGKKHHPLPPCTVIPTKVGIQAESRKATPHPPTTPSFPRRRESRRSLERNTALSYYPVIPNHFDLPRPCQAQAFSARYLIPSCRLSCTDCRNSSPQRLMSLCCTIANIDRTRDSRSALPRVNPT